jgi:hypothetical protein
LFLQLDKWRDDERSVGQLKNEIEWINKFREMGIKTPKYFKTALYDILFLPVKNQTKVLMESYYLMDP